MGRSIGKDRIMAIRRRIRSVYGPYLMSILVVSSFCVQALCGEQQQELSHSQLLETAVRSTGAGRGGFQLVRFPITARLPVPDFRPVQGLDDDEAVPFLTDVLKHGPDWTDKWLLEAGGGIFPHLARCYAALCLGIIGDEQAFAPLREALLRGDFLEDKYVITYYEKDKYHISEYAALALGYLGDPNAVELLIEALRENECEWAIYGLTMLRDVRAIKPIIEYASDHGKFDYGVHSCLEFISRAHIRVKYSTASRKYTVLDFPELGERESDEVYEVLWQHWLTEADKFARQQFEQCYPKLERLLMEKPDDRTSQYWALRDAIRGGIPTLPYIVFRIEEGDDFLVPAVIELIYPRVDTEHTLARALPKDATRTDCLNWWAENKQKWLLFETKQ